MYIQFQEWYSVREESSQRSLSLGSPEYYMDTKNSDGQEDIFENELFALNSVFIRPLQNYVLIISNK